VRAARFSTLAAGFGTRMRSVLALAVLCGFCVRSTAARADFGDDVASAAAGGVNLVISGVVGIYVDELEADGDSLPPAFAEMVRQFMVLDGFDGAFSEEDLLRVHILPVSHDGADVFLKEGSSGVTLDSLIIFKDELYSAIMTWNRSWDDVVTGTLTHDEDKALFLALHELVHVRQFREHGRAEFLDAYLPAVMRDGDHGAQLEQDAYAVAPHADSWARRAVADYAAAHPAE
jgi:hypothetical protein